MPQHDHSGETKPQSASTPLLTVSDWLQSYREGATPRQQLSACLQRARTSSPPSTWIYLATAEDLAAQLDHLESLQRGMPDYDTLIENYPLFGVPFAAKDNIDIAGKPTTAACPAYQYSAKTSAKVIRRLQAAGAVWIGKTNLDQFATGLVGTRSPYGQPSSVFNADYISGGSSSGSAVAVAACLVAFSLGTDTAGSGRVPAGFNQLVGLKPTPGRVGSSGVVPACRTLDCVSIFALTVDDAAQVLAVIEGDDPDDSYSHFAPGLASWIAGPLRIGIPREVQLEAASGYHGPYLAALEQARQLGHTLVPTDFTLLHQTAQLLYFGPWVAERHSVVESLMQSQPQALDPVVQQVISIATNFSATDTFRAQYALKGFQQQAAALWDEVDLLLVPTAPMHPRHSEVAADPLTTNSALGTYTNFVNLLGWCALALPAGQTANGMPFGVTFIAPANHDAALAEFGAGWQSSLDLPLGGSKLRPSALNTISTPPHKPAVQPTLPVAVVGAHLSGMPLNSQLTERGARLLKKTTTAANYRLYALPGTTPPKPGLVRVPSGGHAIELEVWDVPLVNIGSFLALIPAPLGLGSIELNDGQQVHGFLCESCAVEQAPDVSHFGGWRNYLKSLASKPASVENTDATLPRFNSR
ncbi:MAG: allophanate hydrolase [Betaproteobacteria bacterium]